MRRQNLRPVYPTNNLTLEPIYSKFNFHRELFVQKTNFYSEIRKKNIVLYRFCPSVISIDSSIFEYFLFDLFSAIAKKVWINLCMFVVYTLSFSLIKKMKSAIKWNFLNVSILINQQMQFNMPSSCSRGCFFYIQAVHQNIYTLYIKWRWFFSSKWNYFIRHKVEKLN